MRDISLQKIWVTLTLTFDLSRSPKVKCDGAIGLLIYDLLLMFNSNIRPTSATLRDINLRNFGDLNFKLSRSLKVKCDDGIGLPTYGFL